MVNVTVGAGVFGLPALVARALGASAILAYLLCALVIGVVGLCLAEAGSRVASDGGMYAYAKASFGPYTGAITGTLLWVAEGAIANAAVAVLLADTVGTLWPVLAPVVPRALFLVSYYALMVWVNVRGTRKGAVLSQVMTVVKLLPLVALVVLGLPHVQPENLVWETAPSLRTLGHTTVLACFAFVGFETALGLSGEIRNPERTVPKAILLALLLIGGLYVGLQTVAQGILGPGLAGAGASPLGAAANIAFGGEAGTVILWATVLSTAGLLAGDALNTPRVLFAFARDGLLPRALGRVDPTFQTPARAIVAYAVICLAFALTGTFRFLAVVAGSGTLMMYLICSLGVLRLRSLEVHREQSPFVVPGGPAVPLLAALVVILLLSTLELREFLALAALIAIASVLFLVVNRHARKTTGSR
jgi:APA family basic amino acid/polyamine antiporter